MNTQLMEVENCQRLNVNICNKKTKNIFEDRIQQLIQDIFYINIKFEAIRYIFNFVYYSYLFRYVQN